MHIWWVLWVGELAAEVRTEEGTVPSAELHPPLPPMRHADYAPISYCAGRTPDTFAGYDIELFERVRQQMGWRRERINMTCLDWCGWGARVHAARRAGGFGAEGREPPCAYARAASRPACCALRRAPMIDALAAGDGTCDIGIAGAPSLACLMPHAHGRADGLAVGLGRSLAVNQRRSRCAIVQPKCSTVGLQHCASRPQRCAAPSPVHAAPPASALHLLRPGIAVASDYIDKGIAFSASTLKAGLKVQPR